MDKITENIWIGDHKDAEHSTPLKERGIDTILNCAATLHDKRGPDHGILLAHAGIDDFIFGTTDYLAAYYSAVFQLGNLVKRDRKILVHCGAGHSRSPSVVIMYLNSIDQRGWEYWREFISSKRKLPDDQPRQPHRRAFDQMDFDFIKKVLTRTEIRDGHGV